MSEEQATAKNQNTLTGVPIAIVIVGGLIAVAIYFGGGGSLVKNVSTTGAQMANNEAKQPVAALAQPPQPQVGDVRSVTDVDHIRGAKNAKVTIIEYSDFECPFCKRFHPIMQQIVDEYPNDVRWVYRQFPLEQLHSKAPKQAEATECAGEQGKFWELVDKIFEVTPSNDGLNMADLPKLAVEVGVTNMSQFQSCLDSGKYAGKVAADVADAVAAGGRGTPYSIVIAADGQKFPLSGAQPYSVVKQLVDQALSS